jgi:hypothetical protein
LLSQGLEFLVAGDLQVNQAESQRAQRPAQEQGEHV